MVDRKRAVTPHRCLYLSMRKTGVDWLNSFCAPAASDRSRKSVTFGRVYRRVGFHCHQRYVAILALSLALAAFHIAMPGIANPNLLLKHLKNERIARMVPKAN